MIDERFSENTLISGVPAGTVAGIVQAEGGIFAGRCYEGLLAVAQAMSDMTESGKFGKDLSRVLRNHFRAPAETFHRECLMAVRDVFVGGVKRNPQWKILQIRPFEGYADDCGEPDRERSQALRAKYRYLGKDSVSEKDGRFYFGKRKIYRVNVCEYKLRSNASLLQNYMRAQGRSCILRFDKERFSVLAGAFSEEDDAQKLAAFMREKGYSGAKVVFDF